MRGRKPKRHGIAHPAIAKTWCPFCRAVMGVPCRSRENPHGPYVRTHSSRIRAAERVAAGVAALREGGAG